MRLRTMIIIAVGGAIVVLVVVLGSFLYTVGGPRVSEQLLLDVGDSEAEVHFSIPEELDNFSLILVIQPNSCSYEDFAARGVLRSAGGEVELELSFDMRGFLRGQIEESETFTKRGRMFFPPPQLKREVWSKILEYQEFELALEFDKESTCNGQVWIQWVEHWTRHSRIQVSFPEKAEN